MKSFVRGLFEFFRRRKSDQGRESPIASRLRGGDAAKGPLPQAAPTSVTPTHIRVGLDFGTSCIKVIYRIGDLVRPLFFNHNLEPTYPNFCLPSLIACKNGSLLFGAAAGDVLRDKPPDEGVRRIKMLVAGPPWVSAEEDQAYTEWTRRYLLRCLQPDVMAALLLAHSMRETRGQILRETGLDASAANLVFNINIPIDHIENNQVRLRFERVIAAAQTLEANWDEADSARLIDLAQLIWSEARYDSEDRQTRVFALPEAVAQVVAYVESLGAEEKIHAVIDIGAGTTDVSILYLRMVRNQPREQYWYAGRNIPKACEEVERRLRSHLRSPNNDQASQADLAAALAAQNDPIVRRIITDGIQAIYCSPEYLKPWAEAYEKRKRLREWQPDHIRVFLAGGGSSFEASKKVFSRPKLAGIRGMYDAIAIPAPSHYRRHDERAPFFRMAVAYGLAFSDPSEKVILPSDAPNQTLRLPRAPAALFPGDQLVPRPGWH